MADPSSSSALIPSQSTHETLEKPKPFWGHDGHIHAICYSPDGKQIATGGLKPPLRIWDSDTGELLLEPRCAFGVSALCYFHDGQRLVSGHWGDTIRVWNTGDGELVLERVKAHPSVRKITCSPDNQYIVSGGDDKRMRIWRAEDLTQMRVIEHPKEVTSVNFSPNGSRLATGCYDHKIRIFDVETGALVIGPLAGHTEPIAAVTYNPNGDEIASCSGDHTTRIWDASTGSARRSPLEGHVRSVTCVDYSPDGRQLVSGSWDKTVCIWDSQTGQLIGGPARGHHQDLTALSFAPDGTRFVTAAWDGSMRVWDAHNLKVLLPELTEGEKDLFRLTGPFRGHIGAIEAVVYFPDGERVASVSSDGSVRIWDVRIGREVMERLGDPRDRVTSISISSDGSKLVGGGIRTIRVWDTRTGDVLLWLKRVAYQGACVRFSPNCQVFVCADQQGQLLSWDSESGDGLRVRNAGAPVYTLSFSPDGSRLATGGDDQYICVRDASTLDLIAGPFRGHDDYVYSVAFSPDGLSIVSGSEDNTVRIWDAMTGTMMLGPLKAHSRSVMSVSYSPDGTRICSTSDDKTICMWNAKTGDLLLGPLKGHRGGVRSAAFSPDGKRIVTGSSDWAIKFWDVETGEMIHFPDTHDDQPGSSVLGVGSMQELPATTRAQDLPGVVAAPVHDESIGCSALFSFSRLRRVITNMFHNSRSECNAVELEERHHGLSVKTRQNCLCKTQAVRRGCINTRSPTRTGFA